MKLKQSTRTGKHFVLPQLRHFEQPRLTPRHPPNNRSLPKIIPSYGEIEESGAFKQQRQPYYEKRSLKEKLKSVYKKRKHHMGGSSLEEVEEANVTGQFQREIQRNLVLIKKEKENKKNQINTSNKQRYNSPPSVLKSTEQSIRNKHIKCLTEEDVFTKINQIIANSQSKSSLLINDRNISYSAFVKEQYSSGKDQQSSGKLVAKHLSRKKLKTEVEESKYESRPLHRPHLIKHAGNYNQWRKLSIDSSDNAKIKYEVSSYDMETDRLERIRTKNDLSLKKYFQGKTYLNKLINYRDSLIAKD